MTTTTKTCLPPSSLAEDEPLEIVKQEARAVAKSFGIAACDEVAAALIERVIRRLGGTAFYVPCIGGIERQRVHAQIRKQFDGSNTMELARKYSISPRHIRRIVMV